MSKGGSDPFPSPLPGATRVKVTWQGGCKGSTNVSASQAPMVWTLGLNVKSIISVFSKIGLVDH